MAVTTIILLARVVMVMLQDVLDDDGDVANMFPGGKWWANNIISTIDILYHYYDNFDPSSPSVTEQ